MSGKFVKEKMVSIHGINEYAPTRLEVILLLPHDEYPAEICFRSEQFVGIDETVKEFLLTPSHIIIHESEECHGLASYVTRFFNDQFKMDKHISWRPYLDHGHEKTWQGYVQSLGVSDSLFFTPKSAYELLERLLLSYHYDMEKVVHPFDMKYIKPPKK